MEGLRPARRWGFPRWAVRCPRCERPSVLAVLPVRRAARPRGAAMPAEAGPMAEARVRRAPVRRRRSSGAAWVRPAVSARRAHRGHRPETPARGSEALRGGRAAGAVVAAVVAVAAVVLRRNWGAKGEQAGPPMAVRESPSVRARPERRPRPAPRRRGRCSVASLPRTRTPACARRCTPRRSAARVAVLGFASRSRTCRWWTRGQ